MRYELFDFQKNAVAELLRKMQSMRRSYEEDDSLSAVSLTAPTGAGKTVISAAVAAASNPFAAVTPPSFKISIIQTPLT